MSKIYIVQSSNGQYEDYRNWNEKAFYKKEDAIQYSKELDSIHNQTPSFVTKEFIDAYDEAFDEIPDWEEYNGSIPRDEYSAKQHENDINNLLNLLKEKGFNITKEQLDQYKDWEYNQYFDWNLCSIEELDIE